MKKFLRDRKNSITSKSKPVVSAPAPLAPSEPPLYARFATAQDARPAVSGPMHLSSKTSLSRVSGSKSAGQEGHARVLTRMPSRQEQVQSKPKIITSPPARSSSRASPPVTASPESPRKVLPRTPTNESRHGMYAQSSGAGASSSRVQLPEVKQLPDAIALDHYTRYSPPLVVRNQVHETPSSTPPHEAISAQAFPRMQSFESRSPGRLMYAQSPEAQASSSRVRLPEAIDRQDSYDTESYVSAPRPLVVRNQDPETSSSTSVSDVMPHKALPPNAAGLPMSSAPQPRRPQQTGFALHDPGPQPPPAFIAAPAHTPRADTQQQPPSRTRYPAVDPDDTPSHTHVQQPASIPPVRADPPPASQPRKAAPSLLATPSVTRKKYSPLAAFGLATPQVSSSTSLTPSSSLQPEPAQSDANTPAPNESFLPTPEPAEAPQSLTTEPSEHVPNHSSSSLPQAGGDNLHSTDALSHTPPLPSPPSVPHSLSQPDVAAGQRTSIHHSADSVPRDTPEPMGIPHAPQPHASLPVRPYPVPIQPVDDIPDMLDKPPTPPTKEPRFAKTAGPARLAAETRNTPSPQNPPPTQQQGPVRGKPLIFAAMAATSEVDDIEPHVVEMVGSASVAAKAAEGYNAYAFSHQGRPTSTHVPVLAAQPPAEQPPQRRKLSKANKSSSRKAETTATEQRRVVPASTSLEALAPSRHQSHREQPATAPRRPTLDPSGRNGSHPEAQSHRKSMSHDGKLQKRSRDGVKTLTDKQLEKLSHRTSYHGATGSKDPSGQVSRKSYVEEPMPARPAAPHHHSSHRTSQSFAPPSVPAPVPHHPVPPMQKPLPIPIRNTPPSQLPAPQWPAQDRKAPAPMQLPTPPEEYTPIPPHHPSRREMSPHKAKRISPQNVEELEVFAERTPPIVSPAQDRVLPRPRSEIPDEPEEPQEPAAYPLVVHLSSPTLLENLLAYLSYYEWLTLASVSKEVRRVLYEEGREQVLARYLNTVGYCTWTWKDPEPLVLTVEDLCHYMRGVSIPSHSYSAIAKSWLQLNTKVEAGTMQQLTFACRAFTRVVLRLRAQAEAEARHLALMAAYDPPSPVSMPGTRSRTLSSSSNRLPAKWSSQTSLNNPSRAPSRAPSPSSQTRGKSRRSSTFQSPLFRLRRAPLLQVFVPSPDGDWLSDASVLECEAELKRAGVLHLMRAGDVVWDAAVGDEANVGRLVWDGSYLIDLDYTYSRVGDPPRYLPTLAFPPSYFHRVIRTMGTGNPVVRIDIAPWADQIHANLQLLQDKLRMDTPQGGRHTVVRWVHRTSFTIRPPSGGKSIRLPMPHTAGPGPSPTGAWVIDPDWYGNVVVETEGTNEGLADLQARCRSPPVLRRNEQMSPEQAHWEERRCVFRILRERSRPGEIWIRVVTDKERII